jgi:hypothetical protein
LTSEEIAARQTCDYGELVATSAFRDWISFDCCLIVPGIDKVFCGLMSIGGDVLWEYDWNADKFQSCGLKGVTDSYDAKLHRSIVWSAAESCMYVATALLHDVDRYRQGRGGAIIRYYPASRKAELVSVPLPHNYIQMIALDETRRLIHGVSFTPERLFSYSLDAGRAVEHGPISSGFQFTQAQNIVVDDDGCAWSPWSVTRAWSLDPGDDLYRLCKYDPDEDRVVFYQTGLPSQRHDGAFNRVDGFFYFGPGRFYASDVYGSLYRIDPATGKVAFVCSPMGDRPSRLTSMALGSEDFAYGVIGREGACELLRFNTLTGDAELLGPVADGDDRCWQVHDVALHSSTNTLYACENDPPSRSGFLWKIALD